MIGYRKSNDGGPGIVHVDGGSALLPVLALPDGANVLPLDDAHGPVVNHVSH